jgi:hypothetical protein
MQADGVIHEIDDVTFRIRYLPPLTASDMLTEIVKTIGPGLGELASGLFSGGIDSLVRAVGKSDQIAALLGSPGEDEDSDKNSDAALGAGIARAAQDFFSRVDKAKLRWMIDELAKVSEVQTGEAWPTLKGGKFQLIFTGRPGLMYRWLWAALQTNFADFFDSLRPVIGQFGLKMRPGRSSSPSI